MTTMTKNMEIEIQEIFQKVIRNFEKKDKSIEQWRVLYNDAIKVKEWAQGLKSGIRKGPGKEYFVEFEKVKFKKEIKESMENESWRKNGLAYSELKELWWKIIEILMWAFVESINRNESYYLLQKVQDAAFKISEIIYNKDENIVN